MRLKNLLSYNDIVIQCHDNPDADALASGYALFWYLTQMGKSPRFIYRGHNKLQKSNLLIMVDELDIPIEYAPEFSDIPELLVTVDCQYGQKNITTTPAQTVAIIDHHQQTVDVPALSEIRSNIGSCSTIMWDLISKEGLNLEDNTRLSTALYYGLFTDTNKLSEVSHPLDRDMLDSLIINHALITQMSNSNITLDEFILTGKAILSNEYFEENKYLIIEADPCDPNILGVISDFSLETAGVDVCVAFYSSSNEVKFSVRSCTKEVHADELAAYLAEGYGGGGGHRFKAGGSMRPEKLDKTAKEIIYERLEKYFKEFELIYALETTVNTDNMTVYRKLPKKLGCVKLTDVFPVGTPVSIRTLLGDINLRIEENDYLVIGINGEIYPISENKLNTNYLLTYESFEEEFEYTPTIKNSHTGNKKSVMTYAKVIEPKCSSLIYAKETTRRLKLFTEWDEETYYSADIGDYLVVSQDDPHDIYIIKSHLFPQLYEKV